MDMKGFNVLAVTLLLSLVFLHSNGIAQERRGAQPRIRSVSSERNVPYATNGGVVLNLDLYFPKLDAKKPAPVAVYIHGGGWEHGSKNGGGWLEPVANELLQRGYIVASVDYRLAPEYKWPAFINDVKCSIRFLRTNAKRYNLDPNRIGTWGTSAGGHLVAMLGTADSDAKLEGEHYLDQSSRVQAVVDMFGPSDLRAMVRTPQHTERGKRVFGDENAVKEASPVIYVSKNTPPFLILHGENDALVPAQQAQILYDKLKETGVPAKLVMVKNGTHGLAGRDLSPARDELLRMIVEFFDEHLQKKN